MLGSIVGAIVKALVDLIGKALLLLGVYRAGESAQQAKDVNAVNAEDKDARTIEASNQSLSDAELARRLQRPGPGGG